MFTENRSLKKIDAPPSDIITLFVSTNRPMVALSGPQQQADAFIVSIDKGKTQPVYLCFHIIAERQRLIYTSNTVPTSESARTKLEREAVRFVEDMGFMMVTERFDGLSPRERDKAFMSLTPFVDELSETARDEKPARKKKKGPDTATAESEIEYEEVYEEVEEEVPVEEDEEPPKPEEYESLSDVVTEVSAQEEKEEATQKSARAAAEPDRHEPPPAEEPPPRDDEDAFDLGEELSDMVQTIRDIPENARSAKAEPAAAPKAPEPAEKPPARPEPKTPAPPEKIPEGRQTIVRLLISL
jgi:hypothetical protein